MKNIIYLAILSFISLAIGCSSDETPSFGSVYGIITNAKTNEPIRGAEVVLAPGNLSSITGTDGRYEFTDLESGQYKLQVRASGYTTNSRQITVMAGMSNSCDIILTPEIVSSKIKLSTSSLNFGSEHTKLSFSIQNVGNAGIINWSITDVANWLTISPLQGETDMGKSSAVTVEVNRMLVTNECSTTFIVVADGESIPVYVEASPKANYTFSITPDHLDFGTTETIKRLELSNVDYNGSIDWNISNNYPAWIKSIVPASGSLRKAEQASVAIEIDRSKISSNVSTSLNVTAGEKVIPIIISCDYAVAPQTPYTEISPKSSIAFGLTQTTATVTLKSHYSTTNYTAYLRDCYGSWVSLNKTSGTIPDYEVTQRIEEIIITVNRSNMYSTNESCTLVISAGNDNYQLNITAQKESSGGGSSGGDSGSSGGGDTSEDYSSATITSCDYRVDAEIVSCKWSGSSVVFTYTLTNNGLGYVNDWRIVPPSSMSVIQGGTRSLITDSEGNEYPYPTMTFRTASTTGSKIMTTNFPEDLACKGTVTIKNVPSTAKTISAIIGVYAYPNSQYNMSDSKVTFKNVPIY